MEKKVNELYKNNIIQPLKGFCRVIEEGSIAAASEKYKISPGAFTKQIKCLEKQLGMELFNRGSGKKMLPNEIAFKFYKESVNIVSQLENLIRTFLDNEKYNEEKIIIIGANQSSISKFTDIIKEFKEENSNIDIKIKLVQKNDAINDLINGKLDIYISSKENSENINHKLDFINITDYKPYWVMWKGHPFEKKRELTKNDILNTDLIFNKTGLVMNSLRMFVEENNLSSAIEISECGVENLKQMIKSRFGIWLIFDIFLNENDKNHLIFKNAENLFTGGKYGCYFNKTHKNVVKKFINYLLQNKNKVTINI